ncbi:MAG: hypothetical protein ACI4JD_04285 [Ruminococcus sp.]
MTLWEIFCETGRIDDYLTYRREECRSDDTDRERSVCYASDNERSGFA